MFAPHQDDETLGCGGTIIKKKSHGAGIKVVYMTHGGLAQSHLGQYNLREIRREEALAATAVLGIEKSDLQFLEFPDGSLEAHREQAILIVEELIRAGRPEELYIPYRDDANQDHTSTNRIVWRALQKARHEADVFEYPIWFWFHWPWVPFSLQKRRGNAGIIKNTFRYRFGFRLRAFNSRMPVAEVLDRKKDALDQHRSQMERLVPDPDWKTLGDVAGGAFLESFFQPFEIFSRYASYAIPESMEVHP